MKFVIRTVKDIIAAMIDAVLDLFQESEEDDEMPIGSCGDFW